jgi:acyl carrier protein
MELKRGDVLDSIRQSLAALNAERDSAEQIPIREDTPLLGGESQLDSLAFVAFVADLEERLYADTGSEIVLVGELDSTEGHPFRSVAALADRIVEMAAGSGSG